MADHEDLVEAADHPDEEEEATWSGEVSGSEDEDGADGDDEDEDEAESESESEEEKSRFERVALPDDEVHPEELYQRGVCFLLDRKSFDIVSSVSVLRKAAVRGHEESAFLLSLILPAIPPPSSLEDVLALLTKDGSAVSVMFMGWIAHNDDPEKSFDLYRRAHEMGCVRATARIAYCYDTGHGVARDSARALQLYAEAAGTRAFNCVAAYNLAVGLEQSDSAKAMDLYRRSAAMDYPPALYNLGAMYEVMKDEEKAISCYRRAAKLGDVWAQFNLSQLLLSSRRPYNFASLTEGYFWLTLATEHGDRDARRTFVMQLNRCELFDEAILFMFGRTIARVKGAFGREILERRTPFLVARTTYLTACENARRAALFWVWAAVAELGLVKDVAVLIGKQVYATRGEGMWSIYTRAPDFFSRRMGENRPVFIVARCGSVDVFL